MDRTLRATLLAGFVTFAAVAGLGIFLGFDIGASIITGLIAGAIGALLIWGASRRADSFHAEAPPPVEPSFPGPPEPSEDGHDRHDDEDGHDDDDDAAGTDDDPR